VRSVEWQVVSPWVMAYLWQPEWREELHKRGYVCLWVAWDVSVRMSYDIEGRVWKQLVVSFVYGRVLVLRDGAARAMSRVCFDAKHAALQVMGSALFVLVCCGIFKC